MKLLVGLGNPGRRYSGTRHNIGFGIVDFAAVEFDIAVAKKKFKSLFGTGKIGDNDVCIVKPQTFMNLSGEGVAQFAGYYKVGAGDMLVVHDDIDMPFAKIRFVRTSGSGGHNGIGSIIECMGTNDFWRLKVGIGRPREGGDPSDHVLDRFDASEKKVVKELIRTSAWAVKEFFVNGPESAMQKFNNLSLVSA